MKKKKQGRSFYIGGEEKFALSDGRNAWTPITSLVQSGRNALFWLSTFFQRKEMSFLVILREKGRRESGKYTS